MQTTSEMDEWIQREWLDIEPGGEAVDLGDLAGEIVGGKDVWLSAATLQSS